MSTTVYVVIRKYNHNNVFQPSYLPPPVVTWNAGVEPQIEGVFTYYPQLYAFNQNFQICGPYILKGDNLNVDFRPRRMDFPSTARVEFPPNNSDVFDLRRGDFNRTHPF